MEEEVIEKTLERCRRRYKGLDRRVGMRRIMALVLLCRIVCSVGYSDTRLQCLGSISDLSHHSYCFALRDYVCVQNKDMDMMFRTHTPRFVSICTC